MIWSYNGKDHQLWFMDEDSIRSKKYPNKVLDLSITQYNRDGWGKVYLHSYHGGDNQKWTMENENIISRFQNLRLDIKFSNMDDGAIVGGYPSTSNLNQKWNFNPKERAYFVVKGVGSRKVLDAPSDSSVIMWSHNGKDHQLWFLDGDCIRSKKYPNKVLDLHMADYNRDRWGKVYLHVYNGGLNQFWSIEEPFIISSYRHLYLDVKDNAKSDGSLVGGYEFNGNDNQKWEITFPNSKKSGCIDKTEEKIYNVVQYIPLVGTFWDLFSSIAYASTGCTSVARERGISFGIGIALDVTTVLTGGAAAGATTAIKTGVKVGIKVGIKQGMKATVLVTKQSIKNVVKTAAKKGIKGSLKAGFKKSGKLVVQEVIVDPALFLKNAGKISKKILIHPKRTLKGTWKAARHNIDDLKRLRKRLKDDPSFPKLRCKRGGNALSCLKPPKTEIYVTESQTLMFKSLADETALSARIERSADRFMARQGGNFERELSSAPLTVQRQLSAVDSNVEKAELWAVYQYTKDSGSVNNFAGTAFTGSPLLSTQRNNPISEETAKFLLDSVDETIDQADLIQSYLKKHPQNQEITVYRWEQAFENYKDNGIYETFTFKSTSARNERIKDLGLDLTYIDKYPIEMKINLKRSGTKISDLSDFASQEEYLIPIGTKFRVNVEVRPSDRRIQHVTFTEITQ